MMISIGIVILLGVLTIVPTVWGFLRQGDIAPLGSMSERWLSEHRANPPL